MNRVVPRADIEKFTAALAEKRRRLAKAEHSTRGYRDEDGIWRGGLLSFVRYFWHVLEPGTPFTTGFPVEAICEHLEAVTFGDITNLLINVPPGFCKSLLTNTFWPAWEWGAMELTHIRYVTFSYSSSNTERDNQRFGDLVSSADYQAMYPHVEIRQKGFEMVSNRKHGWKWASSVTGSATGKRGNRAICFPADQLVQTEFGQIPIGDIVEQRLNLRVWSYNRTVGTMELKPIEAWHRNPGRRLVRITLEDGHSVTCTEDHPILSGEGYRKASHLRVGQFLFCKHLGSGVETDHSAPYLACITSVEYLHDIPSVTYCLTVQGNHNLVCGSGASVICSNCDDLNNVKESESQVVMTETNRWFRESLSSRLNNMETDAKVVIAQRVAEGDVSGEIMRLGLPYCHLMIQMEYEWQADEDGNPYTTQIGWVDPRWRPTPEECNGALAWEDRFSEKAVIALKIELGEFAVAAQLQQTPEPRGGGLIKREYWLPAEPYMTANKFPPFQYVIASLDGAFDVKEINDPSALTIWGLFQNEQGYNRAMLIHAWAKRLPISGPKMDIEPGEHESMYRRRAMPHWGLVEWTADTCTRFKADRLLIENKASGKPAAQSLQNSHGRAGWSIVLVEPKGDKYARGLAVQPSFSQGMIYYPEREWAEEVIDQCAKFPKALHDDLYDSTTQAIKHLRDSGLLRSDEDRRAEELDAVRHKGAPKQALYPGFRRRQT